MTLFLIIQADKMTALMYAVKHGARDVIKILTRHKADLFITDAVSKDSSKQSIQCFHWVPPARVLASS